MIPLGLVFTQRCNARCRHCAVLEFAPQDMPLEDAFRYIDQAAALSKKEGDPFSIGFSGGEPFLRYPDLVAAIRYAKEKGAAQVSCTTNGFWGKDAAMARQWATELRTSGLVYMSFSLDDFHQEYIPLDSVLTAFTACREAGLRLVIKCVVTRRTRRLPEVLRDPCNRNLLLTNYTTVQEIAYVPAGKVANRIPKDEWLTQEGIPQEPCPGMGLLAILPNGTTYPCCGLGWTQQLVMGNALAEPIADLLRRTRNGALFAILRDEGPAFFVPYFAEAGCPLPQEGYVNSCHLCMITLGHPEIERILPTALADWKIKQVEKCLGGLWKPDDVDYTELRALAGAERQDV